MIWCGTSRLNIIRHVHFDTLLGIKSFNPDDDHKDIQISSHVVPGDDGAGPFKQCPNHCHGQYAATYSLTTRVQSNAIFYLRRSCPTKFLHVHPNINRVIAYLKGICYVGGSGPSVCHGYFWKVQLGVIACWDFLAAALIKFLPTPPKSFSQGPPTALIWRTVGATRAHVWFTSVWPAVTRLTRAFCREIKRTVTNVSSR